MSEAPKLPRIWAGPVKPAFTNKKPAKTGEWYREPMPNCDVPYVHESLYQEAVRQRGVAVEALRETLKPGNLHPDNLLRKRVRAALAACSTPPLARGDVKTGKVV